MERCPWCEGFELYRHYHDHEWGVPLRDERALFELLILEGAQAGLSWSTILKKREHYRTVFDGFDPQRIAAYDAAKVAALLADPGIVRNRAKVAATIGNAKALSGTTGPRRAFRRFSLAVRGRHAGRQPLAVAGGSPGAHGRVGRDEQGLAEGRLQVRRIDDLLRLHAGSRDGERPPDDVLPPRRTRARHRHLSGAGR
jgi:3-methyladenine DNA glycosylase Tag